MDRSIKKCLFVFDFDHTILDCNSDYVIHQLFNNQRLPDDLQFDRNTSWTRFMQLVLDRLFDHKVDGHKVLSFLRKQKLTDGFKDLFDLIEENGKIVISDSNQHFISHILQEQQIKVDEVFTNHSQMIENRLVLQEHHQHECQECPVNLCKQKVLNDYLNQHQFQTVIYCGDGFNDFCPLLSLKPTDYAFVRKDFKLEKIVKKYSHKLKCQVNLFSDGSDIIEVLKQQNVLV